MTHDDLTTDEPLVIGAATEMAYIKPIRSDDVRSLFPHAPLLPPGMTLFALFLANGSPIMVTDSRESALANAWNNNLLPVTLQ